MITQFVFSKTIAMTNLMIEFIMVLTLFATSYGYKTYEGYQVITTDPLDELEAPIVMELMGQNHELDFWLEPRSEGDRASILVPPNLVESTKERLDRQKIRFAVTETNVGNYIAEVKRYIDSRPMVNTANRQDDEWFADYHTYEEIAAWLSQVAAGSPLAEAEVIGSSFEGRDVTVVKIQNAGETAKNVWIEAGIHAREWISPAVAQWFIVQLLNSTESARFTDSINFHILVNANPDGYDFTWTVDRLWRKTRSIQAGSTCVGVDPNRNFEFHWGESGTGPGPCFWNYPGEEPWSETETRLIRDYVSALDPVPELTFALHSDYNTLLYPYSYDYVLPENWEEQEELGNRTAQAINAANYAFVSNEYNCTSSANLYPSSGDASDWYYELGARFAYLIELRNEADYGFRLPPEYIVPSGVETWEGFKVMLEEIL